MIVLAYSVLKTHRLLLWLNSAVNTDKNGWQGRHHKVHSQPLNACYQEGLRRRLCLPSQGVYMIPTCGCAVANPKPLCVLFRICARILRRRQAVFASKSPCYRGQSLCCQRVCFMAGSIRLQHADVCIHMQRAANRGEGALQAALPVANFAAHADGHDGVRVVQVQAF